MNPRLTGDMLIGEVGAPIAAALNTDSNSDILDMAGFEGVIFIAAITSSVATGVASLVIESNTLNQDGGMAVLAGATAQVTAVGTELAGQVLTAEVYQPRKRYVQAVRKSATANIAFGHLIALRYGVRKEPVVQDATVSASVAVSSPPDV